VEENMPIDMHAHWIPRELSDALRQRTVNPSISSRSDGEYLGCYGVLSIPLDAGFDDLQTRISDMDRNGITHGVLSLTTYGVECLPLSESLPLCQIFNNSVAETCRRYPDRFSGLASLPFDDLDAAIAEFERALQLPGMVGALLPGDGFLSRARADKFRRLFEAADARSAILLIHYGRLPNDPDAPPMETSDNGADRIGTLDMQARLSSNMMTFCFTDFLTQFPNVTVLSHNLGGNIPFEIDRLDYRNLVEKRATELPSKRVREARVLVDCNSLGSKPLEQAVSVYGADKIVVGSDGTDFGMQWARKAIADARISEADKRAILDDNARRALDRVRRTFVEAAE
jgi:predicted TIM-barrel fold metal-dependent hydrolase